MSSIVRMLARARTQGAKRPTPTQSTCLYYDHDNEASKCAGCSSVNTIAVFKDEKWPTPKDGMRNACSTACILLISS